MMTTTAPSASEPASSAVTAGKLTAFFIVTYLVSWAFWLPMTFRTQGLDGLGALLFLAGGTVPSVAGALFSLWGKGRPARREFWSRAWDPRRIPTLWLVLSVLPPVFVWLGSALLADWLTPATFSGEAVNEAVRRSGGLIFHIMLSFYAGALSEEWGWRGFALEPLTTRMGVLGGSLVLAVIWAGWHVPLFFAPGTNQYNLGLFSWGGLWWVAGTFALTLFISWAYFNTQRSILIAVIIHAFYNGMGIMRAGVTFPEGTGTVPLDVIQLLLTVLVIVIAVIGIRRMPPVTTE